MVGAFVAIASVDEEINGDVVMSVVVSAGVVVDISDSPIVVGASVVPIVEVSAGVFFVVSVVSTSGISVGISEDICVDISVVVDVNISVVVDVNISVDFTVVVDGNIVVGFSVENDPVDVCNDVSVVL